MSQPNKRFLITQSLISSWEYSFVKDGGYQDFLKTLYRERTPPTTAMLNGQWFENVVNSVCNGIEISESHEWYRPVTELADTLTGAQQQVKLSRNLTVNGITFVCYGILDFLKAGIIYDTKYSKTYHVGKYLNSPQHSMYFYLVPEARQFTYLICDGKYVYRETYYPDETEPIEKIIERFMDYLDKKDLVTTFCENWRSKY